MGVIYGILALSGIVEMQSATADVSSAGTSNLSG